MKGTSIFTRGRRFAAQVVAVAALTISARAEVQNFRDAERQLWFDAVGQLGDTMHITFTEFPLGTVVTTQYQPQYGFSFLDGNEGIVHSNFTYLNDGFGIDGNLRTTVLFDKPQSWIAFDLPGLAKIELFSNDELFHFSFFGGGGPGHFAGLLSDQPFDKVVILDPSDSNIAFDDMYFGAIPSPSALLLWSGWFLVQNRSGRRRRTSS